MPRKLNQIQPWHKQAAFLLFLDITQDRFKVSLPGMDLSLSEWVLLMVHFYKHAE